MTIKQTLFTANLMKTEKTTVQKSTFIHKKGGFSLQTKYKNKKTPRVLGQIQVHIPSKITCSESK